MLDTPIARLRQIIAVISVRLEARAKEQAVLTEWSTQTLAQFIAATVPTPKGKSNKLLKQAQGIRLFRDAEPTTTTINDTGTGEPPPGSFERFMGAFGRGLDQRRR